MPPPVVVRDRSTFVRPLVVLAAIVTLVLTLTPSASAAGTFVDDDQSVHENDIEWIAAKGITQGCNPPTNNRYCPGDNVTRGQMAAYLERALNMGRAPSAGFIDTSGSTFEFDIDAIAQSGITRGCNPPDNNRYCPDHEVTRGQMAAFLARAFGLQSTNVDYFHDDNGSTFENDINSVASAGITVGCGNGRYCPDDAVTRGQMASFVKRAIAGGVTPPTPGSSPSGSTSPPSELPKPGASKPSGAVVVRPQDNLQSMVSSHPKNTTFYLAAGVHRLESVKPKNGNEFVGAPDAIMSGARILSGFQKDGSHWVVGGQTQQNERSGQCDAGQACTYPEQLFIDHQKLRQVTSRSQVKSGTWYFDYGANKIYIGDNPSGHLVETSVTPHAFIGDANGVTIRDLVIEKYATPAAMGAIHGQSKRHGNMSDGWRVIGNEIRLSASNGVHMGDRMLVKANYLHHNGLMGIGSSKTKNVTAEGNEISYNCYASGLKCFGWEGGGVKFAGSSGATLRANYVHHNYGHGLWTDVQASNSTVVDNRVEHNYGVGILIEVSSGAVVHDNSTYENGHRVPVGRGAGIHVSSSEGVSIKDNTVRADAAGIVAVERGRSPGVYNLTVTNNTVISSEGWSGLKNSNGSADIFSSRNITWNNNSYNFNGISKPFVHGSSLVTTSIWRQAGYDNSSSFK